ncbi:LacI family DNA-binding transcriptional regulator [Paenibacillus wulumuqiensis]|uniref:LacI family DNA-binding transcriptional regulator n=1 Tax=Paenibacillus wulumuqiensis TaxID=1567107 RepID=UPI000698FB1A|nr:LacI family DNA-binding transcriptional regulator [Paenibacillus wulumuqiensis]
MGPTIHDVARLANTSKSTVSRYLNGQRVRRETQEALEKAIKELNYHRNMNARRLVMNKTFNIGVIVDNISNTFYSGIIRGIEQIIHTHGYNSVFYSWDSNQPQESHMERKRESSFLKLLYEGQVDGIILLSFKKRPRNELEEIRQMPYPVVLIGDYGELEDILAVDVDNGAGIVEAVRYLYQLGHRRIAYISGPEYATASAYRFKGYSDALAQHQLEYDPALVMSSDWSKEGGYQAVMNLLQQADFTAVIGSNDETAIGALRAARESGLSVPEQMSVIGYDDIPISEWVRPALTTIRQPFESIGRQAAEGLFERLYRKPPPHSSAAGQQNDVISEPLPGEEQVYLLQPSLVIRDSCAGPITDFAKGGQS